MRAPGIYHDLTVKFLSRAAMTRKYGKSTVGAYQHGDGIVYLDKTLPDDVLLHTFFHEIAHHIEDTLEDVPDLETRCDVLGAYLIRLSKYSLRR